jgi:hypothetical protein
MAGARRAALNPVNNVPIGEQVYPAFLLSGLRHQSTMGYPDTDTLEIKNQSILIFHRQVAAE